MTCSWTGVHRGRGGPAARRGHHRPAQLRRRPADRPDRRQRAGRRRDEGQRRCIPGRGFSAAGAVRLHDADITGQLNCAGAQLTGYDRYGDALIGDGMKVSGDVFLNRGFTAAGAVRLPGADITGQLNCGGARLAGQGGNALGASGMRVGGDVFLDGGFTAAGTISLNSAHVGGSVSLRPSRTGRCKIRSRSPQPKRRSWATCAGYPGSGSSEESTSKAQPWANWTMTGAATG